LTPPASKSRKWQECQECAFGEAWAEDEKTKAKARQAENAKRNQPQNVEMFPPLENTGKSRDAIADRIGVSGQLSLLIGLAANHRRWQYLFPQPCQRVIESSLVSRCIVNVRYFASRMT
jgi:hypothetical protein